MDLDVFLKNLPKGVRFKPSDEELIDFLRFKNKGKESEVELIAEIDLCKWEPFELPRFSKTKNGDPEWLFFCPLDQKYPKSLRSNRATEGGYWKVTGKPRDIKSRSSRKKLIGTKRTLVFHVGRAPKGQKTNWIIHEYRTTNSALDAFVLCRLFDKNENTEYSNNEDVVQIDSSPTSSKSSLDGMSSNHAMVQATWWPDDESDNMSSNALVAEERDYSNYMTSHVEDHEAEMITKEVGFSNAPTLETLEPKISPPLPSDMQTGEGYSYLDYSTIALCDGFQFQDSTNEFNSSFNKFLEDIIIDMDAEVAQEQVKAKPPIVCEQLLSSPLPSDMLVGEGSSYLDNSTIAFNNGLQFQNTTDEYYSSFEKFCEDIDTGIDAKESQEQVKAKPATSSEQDYSTIAFCYGFQFQDSTNEYDSSLNKLLEDIIIDMDAEVAQEQVKAKPPIVCERLLSSPFPSDMLIGEGSSYLDNSTIAFNNGLQFQNTTDEYYSSFEKFCEDIDTGIDAEETQEQVKAKPATTSSEQDYSTIAFSNGMQFQQDYSTIVFSNGLQFQDTADD